MGSDAAGCTDFGAIRQGQLGNNLGVAALICPRNKALRARYARGLARRRFVPPHIPSHLRNQQPLSVVFHDRASRAAPMTENVQAIWLILERVSIWRNMQ
ncbi:hypothetical protein KEM44_21350 [Sinorhizobium meliloti]|nr:hypothetical protein KEM44_21350 [Sinorhizobium meliloti]